MSVSGSGYFKVDPALGFLYVDEGQVTVTGDAGGFNVTFGEYVFAPSYGDPYVVVPPVHVGYDGYGAATLTLVGGGDGVAIAVEDDTAEVFSATVNVGVGGQSGANNAQGSLDITAGATVISRNNGLYDPLLGFTPGGSYNVNIGRRGTGTVNVSGDGSFLGAYGVEPRITVGREGGSGTLSISSGGDVGTGGLELGRDNGYGKVSVDGLGSTLTVSNDFGLNSSFNGVDNSGFGPQVWVGRAGGTGAVEINNGGLFSIANLDGTTDGAGLQLGRDVGSYGRLKLQGDGSTLNITQTGPSDDEPAGAFLSIGRGGHGVVDLYDNAILNVTGDRAFVEVGADSTDGSVSGLTSTLNISSGGVLEIDSQMGVVPASMGIAQNFGTSGIVTVEGEGSTINISSDGDGSAFGAALHVGRRGDGQLSVLDGADVTIDGGGDQFPVFFVGVAEADGSANGSGYAKISGPGSTVTVTGDNDAAGAFIAVARRDGAYGKLVVENGGVVQALGAATGLEIATTGPGQSGTLANRGVVIVTGAGSLISVSEDLTVSADVVDLNRTIDVATGGDGRLDVALGARIEADLVTVGDNGALGVRDAIVDADLSVTGRFFAGGEGLIGGSLITGDLVQTAGVMAIEIDDGAAGSDLVEVGGDVTIDSGVFAFDLAGLSRVDLSVGDEFVFLTAGGTLDATLGTSVAFANTPFKTTFEVVQRTSGATEFLALRVTALLPNALPIAIDDTFVLMENQTVSGDLLDNDDTTDGPALTITAVNGQSSAIGATITLASGARLHVNADGNVVYDPSGAFDDLSSGQTAQDSVIYTVSDGEGGTDQATVSFTINGVGVGPTSGADLLRLSGDDDRINALGGADTVRGGGGDDLIQGGGGNDRLIGQAGGDSLFGNGGKDTLIGGVGNDRLLGGGRNDRLSGGAGRDNLLGQRGDDRLAGGGGNDILKGGGGKDALFGGGGNDRLIGSGGPDRLIGGGGKDTLLGGGGRDTLVGGRGDDVLNGGGGLDRFVFNRGDGDDRIKQFTQGEDLIQIGRGANDFDDLTISQAGRHVLIEFANVDIVVEEANAAAFDEDDFIF